MASAALHPEPMYPEQPGACYMLQAQNKQLFILGKPEHPQGTPGCTIIYQNQFNSL